MAMKLCQSFILVFCRWVSETYRANSCNNIELIIIFFFNRSKLAQEKPSSFQDDVIKNLLGCIVLTRYNNKTYRIDDIEWDKNPSDTFETSSGKSVTFQEYYWYVITYLNFCLFVWQW